MKQVYILAFCFFAVTLHAQSLECVDNRYRDITFDSITITKDQVYGTGITHIKKDTLELSLNIYEPYEDNSTLRPAILLAFGGSFINGSKEEIDWLAKIYASVGYVAITFDYRLYDGPLLPIPTETTMYNVVGQAISDMRGAYEYVIHTIRTDNPYRIDEDNFFVGGISAGAIAANHLTYVDSTEIEEKNILEIFKNQGAFEGDVNDYDYPINIRACINYSGGLRDASYIDADDSPLYSVHDDRDPVVPYGPGFATIFGVPIAPIQGSKAMQDVADSVGIKNELLTFNTVNHVGYFQEELAGARAISGSLTFMADLFCDNTSDVDDSILDNKVTLSPNPASHFVEIETSLEIESIEFYSMDGRLIKSSPYSKQVDVSQLQSGAYVLNLKSKEGKVITKKLVRN